MGGELRLFTHEVNMKCEDDCALVMHTNIQLINCPRKRGV
jgi:hypothetical protein